MTYTKQGTLTTGDNIIIRTPNNKTYYSKLIMLNNLAAYIIEIKKYDAIQNITILLAKLNLSAGDTVLDTTAYQLNKEDRLIVNSSVAGTTYMLNFSE
jgi:hypothetical protein